MTTPYITPIIFSDPMVRALLNGRKCQTRRLVTSQWANLKMHHDLGERCFVWVREAWLSLDGQKYYKACTTPDGDQIRKEYGARWKPSIHMPRWASRLTLEVTDVRLQRLQDISEADAVAEGIQEIGMRTLCKTLPVFHWREDATVGEGFDLAWAAYSDLWESLHGRGSWDANPEVVAVSFRVHQQNIDALLPERGAS